MTTVFLSGSRSVSRLDDAIRDRIRRMTDQEFAIVIGDASGADKAMQIHLAANGYRNVTVFCAGQTCRNNVGEWPTRHVEVPSSLSGRDFYTVKDKAMAGHADYGFVLWDGKSAGSINNVLELVRQGKSVVVHLSTTRNFAVVKTAEDITRLLELCDRDDYLDIARKTNLTRTMAEIGRAGQATLNL